MVTWQHVARPWRPVGFALLLKHMSSDTVDLELELLSPLMRLDLATRSQFPRQHPRFLMFSKPNRWGLVVRAAWTGASAFSLCR
jgi:hypothetical protein